MKISIFFRISVQNWMIVCYSLLAILHKVEGCFEKDSYIVKRDVKNRAINPCQWENDCEIKCLSGGSSYPASMQSVYDEHPECNSAGVKLILPRDVTGYTLSPNWLTVNMTIIELEVDFFFIDEFKQNAFASNIFSTIKKFVIKNLRPTDIRKWAFVGLESLETFVITDAQFIDLYGLTTTIDVGVLEFAKDTLKSFTVIESMESKRIYVANMLGENSAILSNVDYVKIQYNLNTINVLSFTAIPYVKELDLSDCYISVIGERSFDGLGTNLELLNLERNKLTTLPEGIFVNLHLSQSMPDNKLENLSTNLAIRLSENPWHCDCSLLFIKQLLGNYTNFEGDILCTTPEVIQNYTIRATEFCPDPITTDMPTVSTTSEETTTGTTEFDNNLIEKQCSSFNGVEATVKISIQPQIQPMTLTVKSEDVSISIESSTVDLVLIWFGSDKSSNDLPEYHQSAIIDCVSGLRKEIVITNLEKETAYTFCIMNIANTAVSPLDCISYYHQGVETEHNKVWLLESSKPLIISVIAIGLVSSIVVGTVIGAIFLRCNKYDPFSGERISFSFRLMFHCSRKESESIKEASNPNFVNNFRHQGQLSQQYQINGAQRYVSGFGPTTVPNEKFTGPLDADNPPPLPPHPKLEGYGEDDDNYYATVKYKN